LYYYTDSLYQPRSAISEECLNFHVKLVALVLLGILKELFCRRSLQ
jgi:type III secretory pathway component EscS